VNRWKEWIEQLRRVARAAQRRGVPTYVIGSSWGARPALAAVAGDQRDFAGAILLNPALKTGRDFAFFVQSWFGIAIFLAPNESIRISLGECDYTPRQATRVGWLRDPRMTTRMTYGYFGQTLSMRCAVNQDLPLIRQPVLALLADDDPLVVPVGVETQLSRIPNARCSIQHVPHATHCAQIEDEVDDLTTQIVHWLSRVQKPSSG
jgi:pimeloyl-ACP methyl ester carboxylesterase